jgi:hypothetical protein
MWDEVPSGPSGLHPKNAATGCATAAGIVIVLFVLASISDPFGPFAKRTDRNARLSAASSTARGIHMALLNYAADHNGEFPTATTNSNEAYRKLIPGYLDNEKPFFVWGCAWHKPKDMKQPENVGEPPDYGQALERGENHWAYVSGHGKDSSSALPIIADGFSEVVGVYTDNPTKKGGVWRGDKAIVVYVDGSVKTEPLDPKTFRVIRPKGGIGKVDIFSREWGTDPGEVFNPE